MWEGLDGDAQGAGDILGLWIGIGLGALGGTAQVGKAVISISVGVKVGVRVRVRGETVISTPPNLNTRHNLKMCSK